MSRLIKNWDHLPCDKCKRGKLYDKHFINAVRVLAGLDPLYKIMPALQDVICSACGEYGHNARNRDCPARYEEAEA